MLSVGGGWWWWWEGRIKDATSVLEGPWSNEGQTCRVRKARWEGRWPCRLARQGGTWSLPACDISRVKSWARRRLFQAEDKEFERDHSAFGWVGWWGCKKSGRTGAMAARREEANGWEVGGMKYLVCLMKEFGFHSGGRGQMATEERVYVHVLEVWFISVSLLFA